MSNNTKMPVVGFIGLGDQGLPIAIAIARAGYTLHAWDQNPEALDALVSVEHVRHTDSAELAAACGIVCLCVSTDKDVLDIVSNGLIDALRSGSVVINHGTGTPSNATRLSEICAASGIALLDAPVSGGRPAAEERRLTTMIGGDPEVAASCQPLFGSYCRHVFYLGSSGAGQAAKLFNNTLLMMNQANLADIIEMAVSFGMDPVKLTEVLKVSSANSRALELLNTMVTLDTVDHLTTVQILDMEIFEDAMNQGGIDASFATARGIEGTNRLPGLLRRLNP